MQFFAISLLSILPLVLAQDATSAPPTSTITTPSSQITDATALCEPHGDHWHCPAGVPDPTTPPPAAASATDDDHDDDHTGTGTEDPGPSPTASYGCEPHGDHWHCDGPRTTGADGVAVTTGGESASPTSTGAAGRNWARGVSGVVAAGVVLAAL